ncbi:AbrB family transcriptional regulator [Variovorax sp. J31P207]|nr:AbrB family transcriptional regulator [Variovorax sp. J31P207]MDM0068360.1 AbrB family transcriptional regulator [Variovorax sp. J31P207]
MSQSTISAKGRTTVPADVRARMGAKPGTRLSWSVLSDGTVVVRAKTRSILSLAGMLKAPDGTHLSIDELSR